MENGKNRRYQDRLIELLCCHFRLAQYKEYRQKKNHYIKRDWDEKGEKRGFQ